MFKKEEWRSETQENDPSNFIETETMVDGKPIISLKIVHKKKNYVEIELDKLVPFDDYPLRQLKGQRLTDMIENVRTNGIIRPIIVRPAYDDGEYEILNGHYRVAAANALGFKTIPAIIREGLSDEEALLLVSDTSPLGLLTKHGVDIYDSDDSDYKKSAEYKNIENSRVFYNDSFSMALDEYIESFLLDKDEVQGTYRSKYEMGNPCELSDGECQCFEIAKAIVMELELVGFDMDEIIELENSEDYSDRIAANMAMEAEIETVITAAMEIVSNFTKPGGYVDQLARWLNVDLYRFDYGHIKRLKKMLNDDDLCADNYAFINLLDELLRNVMYQFDYIFIDQLKESLIDELHLFDCNPIKRWREILFDNSYQFCSDLKNRLKEWLYYELNILNEDRNYDIDRDIDDNIGYDRTTRNKCERAKILYFLYMLKNRHFPNTDILELLSKPSMENIDNSFLGRETSNGRFIKLIKHCLEIELSVAGKYFNGIVQVDVSRSKDEIKKAISHVQETWGDFINSVRVNTDFLADLDYEYDFDGLMDLLKPMLENNTNEYSSAHVIETSPLSPVEMLYLRVLQLECLGQAKDILAVHHLQTNKEYDVPQEYIDAMIRLDRNKIKITDVEGFVADNTKSVEIAKYVYLKPMSDPARNKERYRAIRDSKTKVHRFIEFCFLADPYTRPDEEVSELLIISCLQAIMLDDKAETFDYAFHGSQGTKGKRKGQQHVQAALKSDTRTYDALQVYWVRKVVDRMYANIGQYANRCKLRELEKICFQILEKILTCSDVGKMLRLNNLYFEPIKSVYKPR